MDERVSEMQEFMDHWGINLKRVVDPTGEVLSPFLCHRVSDDRSPCGGGGGRRRFDGGHDTAPFGEKRNRRREQFMAALSVCVWSVAPAGIAGKDPRPNAHAQAVFNPLIAHAHTEPGAELKQQQRLAVAA